MPAGSLLIWDSRLYHENQIDETEERYVQYVCMAPKNIKANSLSQQTKRVQYFETRRTTNHHPYPIKVNGLKPRMYDKVDTDTIDYDALPEPDLADLMNDIQQLL